METVTDFIFLVSKITVEDCCIHEIKSCLILGRKAMTNLNSILKSRDITFLTKVCIVKAMVFPVVMYGYESWTIKEAECWRIDSFELWCWQRLLRVSWTSRRSNQSILKEINPEYSKDADPEAPILWPSNVKSWFNRKIADAGKGLRLEEKRRTEYEMVEWHHWLNAHEFEQTLGDGVVQGNLTYCSPWVTHLAQWVRKTWNGGKHLMKRQTHIIWQVGSQRALLSPWQEDKMAPLSPHFH